MHSALTSLMFLSLLPNGVCNQASRPIPYGLDVGLFPHRVSQILLQQQPGFLACILCIEKARLWKCDRKNSHTISIDGSSECFGSGNLHKLRHVIEPVPRDEEQEGQNEATEDVPLE